MKTLLIFILLFSTYTSVCQKSKKKNKEVGLLNLEIGGGLSGVRAGMIPQNFFGDTISKWGHPSFAPYSAPKIKISPVLYFYISKDIKIINHLYIRPEIGIYVRSNYLRGNADTLFKYSRGNLNQTLHRNLYLYHLEFNNVLYYRISKFSVGILGILRHEFFITEWEESLGGNVSKLGRFVNYNPPFEFVPGALLEYEYLDMKKINSSVVLRYQYSKNYWLYFTVGIKLKIK